MDNIRVGVIGVGRMGQHHCRVCSSLKGAQFVGIFDIDAAKTRATSEKFSVYAYHKLVDLLDQVDAVVIATPTPTHFDITMQSLERKKHVLVEKPVTDDIHEAEAIAQFLQGNGNVLQVGHIERFNPTFTELIKVLDYDDIISINFRRLSPYTTSNTDVDVVLDLMVHDLDLCNDLTKKDPFSISAYGLMPFSDTFDHVVAQLFYDFGPLITLTSSRVTEQKIRAIEITTKDAYLEADLMNKSICIHRGSRGEFLEKNPGVIYHQESTIERILVPNLEPLSSELISFIDSVTSKRIPAVSISDGLRALRLAQHIVALSHENRRQVYSQISIPISQETISQ